MTLTAAETLKRALKLIQKGWTQGCAARSKKGRPVSSNSRSAVEWCPLGALVAVNGSHCTEFIRRSIPGRYNDSIADWNDSLNRTKEEVIATFKKAIKFAEAQGV